MTNLNQHLQMLRALTHQSPKLEAWAQLWHSLDGWPDEDTLAVAVDYARSTWSWAAKLGDAGALVTVTRAIGGRSPRVRLAAREVLDACPPGEAIRTLARDHLLPQDDADAHDALYKLFLAPAEPTPLDDAEAIYAAMDPAQIDAISASLDATDWNNDPWQQHTHLGKPFMVAAARWQRGRVQQGDRSFHFSKAWRAVEEAHPDDPMCDWLHIDILANEPASISRLASQFYAESKRDKLIAPLVHRLVTSTWSVRRVAFEWLTRDVVPEATPALISGLCDPDAAIRKRCIEGLLHLPAPFLAPAALMLRTTKGGNLISCARLLERVPDVAWIGPIQRAQQTRLPARAREALGRALVCCQIAALAPDARHDDDPENIDKALRTLIKKLPDEKPPTFLPKRLRKLHLNTGKALPPSSARWLARRLSYHRFSREDLAIDAIRDRLRKEDSAALAELIHSAFMGAGRPKKEHPWVLHAQGLFGSDKSVAELGLSINEDGRHLYQKRKLNSELRPHILSIFRQRRSPPVVSWCAYWSRFATSPALKIHSRRILEEIALREGRDLHSIMMRALPSGLLSDKRAERLLLRLLDDAIATRAAIDLDIWLELWSWPEGLQICAGLVFEASSTGERVCFVLDKEGQARDLSGEPVAIAQGALVRLPHPSDLKAEQRRAWARAAADLDPALEQMNRDHHGQLKPPEALDKIERTHKTRPLFFKLEELGYTPLMEVWRVFGMTRTFDTGIEVSIEHKSFYYNDVYSMEGRYEMTLVGVEARRGGAKMDWNEVPTRISVEVVRDLLSLKDLN